MRRGEQERLKFQKYELDFMRQPLDGREAIHETLHRCACALRPLDRVDDPCQRRLVGSGQDTQGRLGRLLDGADQLSGFPADFRSVH